MSSLSEVESLQAEMLAQLTQDIKERLLSEGMLSKLVLINIAAEAYARQKSKGLSMPWLKLSASPPPLSHVSTHYLLGE